MNYLHDDPRRAAETMFLLQAAVESANDAILMTELPLDPPGPRIEYVNPAFTRMTGYSAEEVLGRSPRMLQGPKTDRTLVSRVRQDLATGQSFHGQTINYKKDGSEYFVEWRITPVRDDQGVPIKWMAVQRDVTTREQSEQALRLSELHLKHANRDLEQFVYSASHDLREPIRNVILQSQFITRQFGHALPVEAQDRFKDVIEGAQRMGQLVQDLLNYTRAAQYGLSEERDYVEAETVLAEVLADLRSVVAETGAVITHENLPYVQMRDSHLRQVLQNLLTNALKYRLDDVPPAIHVSVGPNGSANSLQFAVRDNGIGIAAAYHQEIFGVFRRLHDRRYPGTGMGLAITQRILERYGQHIWVKSTPGEGATFYFTVQGAMRASA